MGQVMGASSGRKRNRRGEGERLREELVAAAADLLEEATDVEDISIRQVATAVGVSAPAVYLHFPDKQALLRAAANERFARFRRHMGEAAVRETDPRERFVALGRAYLAFAREHPGHYRVLFCMADRPIIKEGPDDWDVQLPATPESQGKAALQDTEAVLRASLEAAGVTGVDSWAATFFAWTALHGLVDQQMRAPEFPWPDDETMLRFVAAGLGLLPPPGPPPEASQRTRRRRRSS
jgi:AcrR family transcriptional regulator